MKKIAKEMLISELIDQVENKDAVVDKLMECRTAEDMRSFFKECK